MKENNILGILLSIIVGVFALFVGMDFTSEEVPNKVYKVYLNGQSMGMIASEEELLNLIDVRQDQIKDKYSINKVYPPDGLKIKEEYTYSEDIKTAEQIYDIIQDKDPFTISGYTITIEYPDEQLTNESEEIIDRETEYINVLNKDDFYDALKTTVKAFVGSDRFEQYDTNTQPEIKDVGSIIESIYWEEKMTIKENLISVDSQIFTNSDDISKYLLFGTLKEQQSYTIKEGDDIATISRNNNLNTEEFLIANPQFTSENILLTAGQKVNIGLIKPMVTIVSEMHVVEDIANKFKIEYVDDKNAYAGTQTVTQEGSDGLTRVVEKVLYRNGEINNLLIADKTEIVPVVNKIISRGTKTYGGNYTYENNGGNNDWSWPTISPYIITSKYGYRWGSHHDGIDVSGTGHGSPIYAVKDGTVTFNGYSDGYGYYVIINHFNGYLTLYAHMAKKGNQAVGTAVSRETVIGYMGNTGRSTGTHLHFSVIADTEFNHRNFLDPCNSIFRC